MTRTALARWAARTGRFWDRVLDRPAAARPAPRNVLRVEALEDRIQPAGRPLPLPVIAAGAGPGGSGLATLTDALDGATLHTFTPFPDAPAAGVRVAVGDLTGDGYPELVAGAGPGGGPRVRAYDGKSGVQLAGPLGDFFAFEPGFRGGVQVAVGDVMGRGYSDLVVAADAGGGPRVRVFDGKSGAAVADFWAFEPGFTGGVRLAVGHVSGRPAADLVVAAGPGGGPRVRVLDARTATPVAGSLGDGWAFEPGFAGGASVAAGDVTGDGRPDLIVGAGEGGGPRVRVFDGATGAVVRDFWAGDVSVRGGVGVATAFVDDDAFADVVTSSGPRVGPRVRTFSGATGEVLAGPVGDFDPGVGAAPGAVSIAAGNDPPPPGSSSTPGIGIYSVSPALFTPGVAFTITIEVNAQPINLTTGPYPTGTVTLTLSLSSGAVVLGTPTLVPAGPSWSRATLTVPGVGDLSDQYSWGLSYGYSGDANFTPTGGGIGGPLGDYLPLDLADAGDCPKPEDAVEGDPAAAGNAQAQGTPNPVRFVDGVGSIQATDLGSGGFGDDWGVSRTWSSSAKYAFGSVGGNGWVEAEQPRLARAPGGHLVLFSNSTTARYFDGQGTPDAGGNYPTYAPRHNDLTALSYDSGAGEYVAADSSGGVLRFRGFADPQPTARRGALVSRTSPAGVVTEVTAWDAAGRPAEVERTVGTTTESFVRTYVADGSPNAGRLESVLLRRREGAGPWSAVRQVTYEYYGAAGGGTGNFGDLKLVTVADGSGGVIDKSYYRYYTAGGTPGYQGGMKYVLGPAAYDRARAALGGTDAVVQAASDSALAPYADNYFEYDSQRRVTKEVVAGDGCSACSGGQGEYTYAYTASGFAAGPNSWRAKTVETRPDGSTNAVYTNAAGQVMAAALTDSATGLTHRSYTRYDSAGRAVLVAGPATVTGLDESAADLVAYSAGNAAYLADAAGPVTAHTYYSATTATATTAGGAAGFGQQTDLMRGETGVAVPQASWTYFRRSAGGGTSTPVATETRYRNDNGTGAATTTVAYAWHAGTTQPAVVTTTLPAVTTAQNGPNAATGSSVAYDALGRMTWSMDAAGFLSYAEYDAGTGAVVKAIVDVDTTQTADFAGLPSGWATPSGGGLHLKSTAEVDNQGRATKATDPSGRVTYTVYNDVARSVRVYPGWDAATNTPTGPTLVRRVDRAGGYTESLTMSATPAVSGGRATGAEAVAGLQSLTRSYRNLAGQTTHADAYYDLGGLTYTTSTTLGTQNVHFLRTLSDYDAQGRPNRSVSAAGTITRTEYDGGGRAVSEWVGTDDTPTTGFWSVTNLAGTDMVQVRAYEYDGGGAGNGNMTKVTEYPGGGAAARVTQTWFDWRDRPVAVKAGVETSESTAVNRPIVYSDYDNLGKVTKSRLYDGDGVAVTVTAGVPVAPSASLLRAQSATSYDELGRAYLAQKHSVDPATGSVAAYSLDTNTWYDSRGQLVKAAAPGGLVQKTAYDGAGRPTTTYATDGGGDTAYADAGTVTGDAVLTQAEADYDAAGNVLLTTTRERFHDETGTGALGTATTGVKARVSFAAAYYDLGSRMTASVNVGTNGGAAYTRPGTVPARSDTVLVSSRTYDAAGRAYEATDPRGLVARTTYDTLGRTVKTVENYVDGVPSDLDDKTTEYGYGPAGMTSLTARLTGGGGQTTAWVYGVTAGGGSGLASNDVVGATRWPDPATGAASASEQDVVTVNALGQTLTTTDRNGTVHAISYDVLGRVTDDAVTTLGTGIDGAVRRLETAYDGQGNASLTTSYAAAVAGTVVNQVRRDFDGLGRLAAEYQAHGAAVDVATTPKVQYGYAALDGTNRGRLNAMTYPGGRVVSYGYGPAGGLDDRVSRLAALKDGVATLEGYAYLGLGTVVARSRPESGVGLTYVKLAVEADGDGGDRYTGLDRFGRVVDQRWVVAGTGAAVDRFHYTYDRNGNRLSEANAVNAGFSEAYSYDGLDQLSSFARGTRTQAFDYDAVGNFDGVTTDGVTQARTANAQNEVTAVGGATAPTFDAAGNMTGDETGRRFVYDAWNRLVAVKSSGGILLQSYQYDAGGRRISELPAGGPARELYYSASWQVIEERAGGATPSQYVWSPVYVDALVVRDRDEDGDGSINVVEGDGRVFALQDANWDVTALLDFDGYVVERFAYDPYGAATVLTAAWGEKAGGTGYEWRVLFQGMAYDAVAGLSHQRARWYSPTLGRWASTDPIRFQAGDVSLYRSMANNPLIKSDPTGTTWVSDGWDFFVDSGNYLTWEFRDFVRQPTRKTASNFRNTLPFAYRLLEHSLNDNPGDLVFQDNTAFSKKIRASAEYAKVKQAVDKSICSLPMGSFSGEAAIEFNSDTDLFAALHAARVKYYGHKDAQGRYTYTVSIIDTYNFESTIRKGGYTGNYYYNKGIKGSFFTVVNELATAEELLTIIQPYNVTILVQESGCCK